ncbi:MAG: sterol desaturase family protein [Nitrospira sp.]|nr:sterol desaturase family protein [Nitrospira sp.]
MLDLLANVVSLEWLATYWGIGILFFAAEYWWPTRPVAYRQVFLSDVAAFTTYQIFFAVAQLLTNRIPFPIYSYWRWLALPSLVRLIVFLLVLDGLAYWMHRLWHTAWVWPIHRWHHAPTELYWLAGIRASFPQVILAGVPYLLAFPLLKPVPTIFFPMYGYLMVLTNNWMHMNVTWQSRKLEWLFVTPRYHRVHHLKSSGQVGANFGVLFTVWDRLFGTYVDPEKVDSEGPYGIQEAVHPVRMAIGV